MQNPWSSSSLLIKSIIRRSSALRMLPSCSSSPNPNPRFPCCPMKTTTTATATTSSSSSLNSTAAAFPLSTKLMKIPNGSSSSSTTSSSFCSVSNPSSKPPISVAVAAAASPDPQSQSNGSPLIVVSFYKFAHFPDHPDMRKPLKDLCQKLRVSGGIILAPEGINGSICGTRESVETVLGFIQEDDRLKGLRQIESPVSPEEEAIHHGHTSRSPLGAGEDAPFRWDHVRVKLKKEIVSLGMPTVSPIERVGKYVNPREWNELISDPDTVVIDVRNAYETRIGRFKGAVDPLTTAFREFPSWVDDNLMAPDSGGKKSEVEIDDSSRSTKEQPNTQTPPRVAMYCTGGIRCEKASSFLMSKGVKEVYHLKGGILKYLEEIPKTESLWEGECFVFDKRVSVEHGLVQGSFKLCYGCKQPVSDQDMEAPEWEHGVSCPYCFSTKSEEEKERARARQRQFESWGIIGGPDKGRRPVKSEATSGNTLELSKSV